jgi:hypothetical protein
MSMKISCNFQVKAADSCATVRTGLWRHLDALQCLEALELQLSERPSYNIRMLGQATLSSKRSGFQTTLFGKVLPDVRTTWQHIRTLPNVLEYFGFPLQMQKGMTVKTVRTLDQAVGTRSCFGKICVILERRSPKIIRTQLSDHLDAA